MAVMGLGKCVNIPKSLIKLPLHFEVLMSLARTSRFNWVAAYSPYADNRAASNYHYNILSPENNVASATYAFLNIMTPLFTNSWRCKELFSVEFLGRNKASQIQQSMFWFLYSICCCEDSSIVRHEIFRGLIVNLGLDIFLFNINVLPDISVLSIMGQARLFVVQLHSGQLDPSATFRAHRRLDVCYRYHPVYNSRKTFGIQATRPSF